VGLSRYGMWLQSLRWLLPQVAQPQVPVSKKSEMGKAHFRVCPHTTKLETKENKKESGSDCN
jgi:hypothetical protein